jgi:hypothetical protein
MHTTNGANGGWFAENRDNIDSAMRAAVADALSNLKRLGIPAATWKDGQVLRIPPDQIVVDEEGMRQYQKLRKFKS